ncbi:MAG TPA: acyl-CoA dehydrogenase family protein, partial [Gordonia sp. (in: high G+C Gram-positive bacteria)]
MGHYKSNLRDLQFNLFELFELEKVLGEGEYADLDRDTVNDMLREVKALSEGPLAEPFANTDRNPPVFDPETHSVSIPEGFKKAVAAFQEGGWQFTGQREEIGGVPVPAALKWAMSEMLLGAQPAAFMYMAGTSFAEVFYNNGTDEQKKWAAIIAERGWGATMVLTEPDAGSDVGAGRTKAIQ